MIYTPQLSCGLLPGILREYIMERFQVTETIIYPDELMYYEECFVTNSLMGVMPVRQLGNICFPHRAKADEVREYTKKKKCPCEGHFFCLNCVQKVTKKRLTFKGEILYNRKIRK